MNLDLYYFTLSIPDVERGKQFYESLFGWKLRPSGPGSYHIENSHRPGSIASGSGGDGPTIYLFADDPQAAVDAVRANGGEATDVQDARSGPYARCIGPGGVHFSLGRLRDELAEEATTSDGATGELGYFVLPVPDVNVGKVFYGGVFGWEFAPGDQYAHVPAMRPAGGLVVDAAEWPSLWFQVSDIRAKLGEVTALGGAAAEASESESGWSAACNDDQGTRFNLWQPAPDLAE